MLHERGRATLGCGMGGYSYHCPASLEDGPLDGILVRRNLHHSLAFLKGSWSGRRLDSGKGHRDNGGRRSGGRRDDCGDGGGRSRDTRGPRRSWATNKGVSKPHPLFLVQHHTCTKVRIQELSNAIQSTRVSV